MDLSDLGNLPMATSFIYNRHTLLVLFSAFVCLSKSLRKDFMSKLNLADFKKKHLRGLTYQWKHN